MAQTGEFNSSNIKSYRTITDSHKKQIELLQIMADHITPGTSNPQQFDISELARRTFSKDEKEALRYLLILEGQKLVTPYPEGDFTSNNWIITKHGMKAVRTIFRATVQ